MKELINKVHLLAVDELNKANSKFPQFRSKHEAIGVLDEELFEFYEEINAVGKVNQDLHKAVYRDYDLEKPIRSMELKLSAALAEGTQCLAMLKKFRCFLEGEKDVR